MKKIAILIIGIAAVVFMRAGDWPITTLQPQAGDNQVDLDAKTTAALANISGASTTSATMGTINAVIVGADNPVVLGSSVVTFQSATFTAYNAARTPNTSTVFIQIASGNETFGIPLDPGGIVTWVAPPGKIGNASQFYIDGVAGQGVVVIWSK